MPHFEAAFRARPRRAHRSPEIPLARTANRWRWGSRLVAVAAAAGLAASLSGTVQPAGASEPGAAVAPRTISAAPLPGGASDVGPLDGSTALELSVTLDPRDPVALDRFVAGVTTPGSPSYRAYLAPGEFGARFGADPATVARVTAELQAAGLHPGAPDPDRLAIPVEATADEASAAFRTRFARTRLADGRVGHRHTTAAIVPAGAAGVVGLDDWPRSHRGAAAPRATTASLSGGCPAGGAVSGTWSAAQLASAYGLSSLPAGNGGTGQTVALYELSDYANGDVTTFQNCAGVPSPLTRVTVDGGTSDTSGAGEVMLDADIVMGLAPQASILVYVAPNTASGALDGYRAIVNDDRAQVVSVSWGLCETYEGSIDAHTENTLFEQAAAQGQSVFAASGDDGSADCYGADGTTALAVDDPASQPYVTGVGGTTLAGVGPRQESVWNSYGSSGGGGVSQLWPLPAYQSGVHLAASSPCGATGGCRQVPDVAASADPYHGYSVYCSVRNACGTGGWLAFGGTSGAAPLWAAATALLNEDCGAGRRIGFANPALYAAAGALHDVTSGNNDAVGANRGAYTAGAGYDLATGLGTPDVAALAAALCAGPTTASPTTPITTVSPVGGSDGTGAVPAANPPPTSTAPATPAGYWMVTADGHVSAFGDAVWYGDAAAAVAPLMGRGVRVTKLEPTPSGHGYWIVDSAGHVFAFGDAPNLGGPAAGDLRPGERVTSLSGTPHGQGYWVFTDHGRVFGYGDAAFLGDLSATPLNGPILGSMPTASGRGYYLVGSDGGIFAFGDATFRGSMGAARLNAPVESLVPTGDGGGYWLVAGDGGIFAFGDAAFHGSMGGTHLNAPVTGMVRFGNGYLMVATDGGIFDFSDRPFCGSLAGAALSQPVVAVGSLNG